jgi:hypothetical protein
MTLDARFSAGMTDLSKSDTVELAQEEKGIMKKAIF